MTEPLTDEERAAILAKAGYDPSVDEEQPQEPTVKVEILPTKPKRTSKKKAVEPEPEPEQVTAYDGLLDNNWQNEQFQKRKAIVGQGFTKDEASDFNKKLWNHLGAERIKHNKAVRAAQRELSGTGKMREVITAERDYKESVDDLTHTLRESGVSRDLLAEALRRL